jgi:hypothetical protein
VRLSECKSSSLPANPLELTGDDHHFGHVHSYFRSPRGIEEPTASFVLRASIMVSAIRFFGSSRINVKITE